MSSIDKLLIQGIRCYGPGEDQRVLIPFRTPLTVIFGANGTGKTTIIECLKYITTGDMPPNSKGGAFVHDPNIAREREVKGQVKLKFKDVAKRQVTCSRSLQSTQKVFYSTPLFALVVNIPAALDVIKDVVAGVKKIETKTIDSSMEKIGEDGQKRKITSRCAEVDTEMCRHLGVSKAVLNNVIFCHQEDSNWPLSEGKALKTKFDEIFASTRYTKALENIKKFQQEQSQECKVFKVDMQHLQKQKEKAAELQVDLSGTQDKVKESQTSVSYIDSQLKPTEESLQKLDDMYTEFAEKEKSIAGLKSKKQQLEHNQRQLQEKIGHAVTDSIEEVQKHCKDHKSQLELEKKELQESEALIRRMEIERKELDEQRDKLLKQQGRLRSRAEDNQQNIRDRDTLVKKFSKKHDIKAKTRDLSQSDVEEFLASLTQRRKSREQDARLEMEDFNKKIDDIQEKLDDLKLEQAKYNQSKEIKTKQIKENKEKKREIDNELRRIAGLDTRTVERAERELQEAESNLKEFQENTDIRSLETEYESLQRQKRTIDGQVSRLQEELDKLSKQATQRGALETLRKKKEEVEIKISSIMAEVERDLEVIFDVMPTSEDLPSKLLAEKVSQERRVRVAEDKLRKARENKATLSYKKESLNNDLERQNKREQDLQQKIDQVCGGKEYQSLVEEVQRDIESTQDDIAATEGSAPFFKKCVEKVRTSKKCPVCTRGFDSQSDVDKVITTLTSRMNESVPRIISKLKERLREQQQKHKSLQQLKSSIEELEKLTSQEIPVKTNELSSTNRELQSVENDLKKLETECSASRERLQQIRAAEPKVSQLSYRDQDLKKLEQQIAVEEAKLGDIGTAGRSHIVVRREHQNALQEQEEVERKRERKSREIAETKQHLLDLETSVQNLRGEKLKITESMRRREGLMEQKAGLVSANGNLEKEVTDIVSKTTKLQDKLTAMITKKESTLKEKGEAEGLCKAKVNDIVKDERELDSLIRIINSYYSSGDEESLERCEDEISICQRKSNEQARKRNDLQKKINELREQLATAEMRLRKFEDTIQFLNQQKEIGNVAGRIRQLETELRELGVDDYDGEYNRLKNKADQLRKQRAHQEGKKMALEDEMKRIQRDLDSDLYRDADTRYLHRAADIKALEVTTADLDKFYKALDRAITQYHKLKMDEVNKIIQELWIKIYRGGDIDNIEIESSHEADSSSIAKRRVYNYRVVMDKGGVKLDMRGRCSAGQKVLASIVIRLALAETFCLNCGVLTLDEPTTNLDSENVEALAQALADIITARREQSNFQLVVITHDQGFVNMMGRSDHTDDYLLLKREGETTKVKPCTF